MFRLLTTLCILASVINDFVHSCIGCGRLCAFLHRLWTTLGILASVLDDFMHSCIGFKWLCAFLHRLWRTMCILASVLEDCFGRLWRWRNACEGRGKYAPPRPARGKIKTNRFPKMPTFILHLKIEKNRFPKIPSIFYHLSHFVYSFFLVSKLLFPTYY